MQRTCQRVVKEMYERVINSVRMIVGDTKEFSINMGLRQRLTLSS